MSRGLLPSALATTIWSPLLRLFFVYARVVPAITGEPMLPPSATTVALPLAMSMLNRRCSPRSSAAV